MLKNKNLFLIGFFIFFLLSFFTYNFCFSAKANLKSKIYVIPVKKTIDLGLSSFIKRITTQAKNNHADAVVFDIDTFGGRIDAANEITSAIENLSPIPTYAYISNSAWSAGALIALSCKTIIMKTSSSIGSAEPRTISFGAMQKPDEKLISALRAKFKTTAQANSHSANLAQAMVDKDIEIITAKDKNAKILILTKQQFLAQQTQNKLKQQTIISPAGKLLNLTAQDALNLKLTKLVVTSKKECLDYVMKIIPPSSQQPSEIIEPKINWSENLVRFLTHPIISSLFLSLGIISLIFELKMPSWGISGTIGIILLVLFFAAHYLAGLANWIDIFIFCLGIVLLMLEIFVIPGFGIAGISGIILIISGLIFSMLKHPFKFPSWELSNALNIISYSTIFSFLILVLFLKLIPKTNIWKQITLNTKEDKALGFQINSLPKSISAGKIGYTKTMLRPAGKAIFEKQTFEVTTLGEFISQGEKIKINKLQGNKIFVEKLTS
ncbi:MAG: hypothetical protein DRP78_04605 [Candidatus Omnitrophota bacterium]|nr:MAG: hypothetical protein DRP78_04605 [Candidatus Omnitrophota bacterium]